jgi:peptidase M28-like protein
LKALFLLVVSASVAAATPAVAQTSPFLPEALYRELVNEISGDRAYEHDRVLTRYHRTGGSRDFFTAAEYIRAAAVDAGLEDVKLVRQKWDEQGWSCRFGEVWLVAPEEVKLAAYGEVAMSIADHSRTTHVAADLVDVAAGASDADYEGRDVRGKVVLASGPVAAVHREAVWKRGALGVISSMTQRPEAFDAPDQVAWGRLPYDARGVDGVKDGTPSTFAAMISPRRGRWLQRQMQSAGGPFRVKVDIESEYPAKAEQAMVEAWIRGSEVHDQQIVLTAHIQETTSANDDGSGCVNMLEIGRAVSRLIKEGRIPRPRRDIRFWWVNELSSQPRYFRENPQEPAKMLVNLNQDMVGARQSWGGRVQYASRLPWSLPHALDDVMESVLTMVRDGNTAYLTTRGTKLPVPYTREIVAVKGSREPFHAAMVPYYDSTDHHAFTPAHVGVPGTSLTNWPDELIHATSDDLESVDPTQLERNAVVVAAVALYFAGAGDEGTPALAAYVAARAASRVAADLATAVAHLAASPPAGREAAYAAACNLVSQSYRKEAGALASVRRLSPTGRAAAYVGDALARLEAARPRDLEAIASAYRAITGRGPAEATLSTEEQALAGRVYAPIGDLGAWQDAMEKIKAADGLHSMMRFEVYNFADGRRTGLEVYQSVAAEALSAGAWYYGEVKPADVREALERAVEAGAYTAREAW